MISPDSRPRQSWLLLTTLTLAVVGALILSVTAGSVTLDTAQLFAGLRGENSLAHTLMFELRLPRALAALATGALLALAGALMQVLLRNPLADPYVLGIAGGASTAALATMLLGLGGLWLTGSAFAGALLTMLLVFALASGTRDPSRLLLTGIVLAAGWGALINLMLALATEAEIHGMIFWLLGDLSYAGNPWPALSVAALGLVACLALARGLDLLVHGEAQAQALGVSTQGLRGLLYVLGSLLTAAAVTTAGAIGFVGLIIPHLIRLLGVQSHRLLLPASALAGALLLMLADLGARTVISPRQLPVGVITALIGVPLFLYLLHRGRR